MKLEKILIVEDSQLHQKIYDAMLQFYKKLGVQLLTAYNGQEALDVLSVQPDIDLILLDINMPVMTGFEFLKSIKKHKAFTAIPVIIISTEDSDDDIIRGLKMGAHAYLKKPFQPQDLHKVIEKIIQS